MHRATISNSPIFFGSSSTSTAFPQALNKNLDGFDDERFYHSTRVASMAPRKAAKKQPIPKAIVADPEVVPTAGPLDTANTKPTRKSCAVCGTRKLTDQYPLAKDKKSRILVTCNECLINVTGTDKQGVLREAEVNNRAFLKRKRSIDDEDLIAPTKKAKKGKEQREPPATTAECRICTDTKDLKDFPKATAALRKTATYWNRPPPPPTKDIPASCAAHLCVRKSNKVGPVCKECIGNSLAGSLSYKHAEELGCPHENCGKAWDAIQYISQYLSIEDFTSYSEKLFKTYTATSKTVAYCVNTDCNAVGIVDESLTARRGLPQLECPECKTRFCINCKVAWHKDQTCQEYQLTKPEEDKSPEEIKSLKEMVKLRARRCPHCAYAVVKTDGCGNMICKYFVVGSHQRSEK